MLILSHWCLFSHLGAECLSLRLMLILILLYDHVDAHFITLMLFFLTLMLRVSRWCLISHIFPRWSLPLRKYAYSNKLKISPPKTERFQIKILIFFIFLLKTWIVSTRWNRLAEAVLTGIHNWGGSNEYPQYMCLSRNKKNDVYPCKHQFYYIKVGFKRVRII